MHRTRWTGLSLPLRNLDGERQMGFAQSRAERAGVPFPKSRLRLVNPLDDLLWMRNQERFAERLDHAFMEMLP